MAGFQSNVKKFSVLRPSGRVIKMGDNVTNEISQRRSTFLFTFPFSCTAVTTGEWKGFFLHCKKDFYL